MGGGVGDEGWGSKRKIMIIIRPKSQGMQEMAQTELKSQKPET